MDTLVRAAAAAILGAILAAMIKKHNGALALTLSLACCCLLGVSLLSFLRPLLAFAEQLRETAGISSALLTPLLKTVAIGLVTELAATICGDAGESALSQLLQLCGAAAAMYCALPLLQAALELIESLLEG
jgi:stage III sporulation protein AD